MSHTDAIDDALTAPLLALLPSMTARADGSLLAAPCSIAEACEREYRSEALFVAYRTGDDLAARQPRLRKHEHERARLRVLVADIDTPSHAPWSDRELDQLLVALDDCAPLATAAWYLTPRGLRVLQPLDRWIEARDHDAIHLAWTATIAAAHPLLASAATEAHDWTHLYRPAICLRREGRAGYRAQRYGATGPSWREVERTLRRRPALALRSVRCEPISPPAPLRVERRAAHYSSTSSTHTRAIVRLPALIVEHLAVRAGAAIRESVHARWHQCYLALAGALLDLGCPADALEDAVALALAQDPGWGHLEHDRRAAARSTIAAAAEGRPYAARATLARDYPAVEQALRLSPAVERVLAQVERERAAGTEHELELSALPSAISDPSSRLHVIVAPPGAGKTRAVLSLRHKARWALSVPTHALAEQCLAHDTARIERLFSPPSLRDADGQPVCVHHAAGAAFASARISVRRYLCRGCERAGCCVAEPGREGAAKPTLVVAPHALLRRARERAHKRAAIVLDEPPYPVTTVRLHRDDLARIRSRLLAFADATRMRIQLALDDIDRMQSYDWTPVAWPEHEHLAPSPYDALAATRNAELRLALASAARAAHPILDCSVRSRGAMRRVDLDTVELGYMAAAWIEAASLDRDQRAVVLDASADAWLPIARALWPAIDVTRLRAESACRHDTVVLATADATRNVSQVEWLDLAQRAVDFVCERGAREIGLITTLNAEAWVSSLRLPHDARVIPGHYGAVRGLNAWAHCDALITVIDPRPHLGIYESIASYASWATARSITRDELVLAHARAELEQAHGRLRTIHREQPAISVHVGAILPPRWTAPEVVDLDVAAPLSRRERNALRTAIVRARIVGRTPDEIALGPALTRIIRTAHVSERAVRIALDDELISHHLQHALA